VIRDVVPADVEDAGEKPGTYTYVPDGHGQNKKLDFPTFCSALAPLLFPERPPVIREKTKLK
jgi:hypothetical protein